MPVLVGGFFFGSLFFHFVLPPATGKQRRFEDEEEEMPTPEWNFAMAMPGLKAQEPRRRGRVG